MFSLGSTAPTVKILSASPGKVIFGQDVVPLFPALFFFDQRWSDNLSVQRWKALALELALKGGMSLICFFAIVIAIWQVHFSLCTQVKNNRWYGASDDYKVIIARGESKQFRHFSTMLHDSYEFFANYQRGVPKLDICKQGENGSYPLSWLVGAKSINYRWEKAGEGYVRYLFLQCNPIIWFTVLGAVICSVVLVGSRYLYGLPVKDPSTFFLIVLFTILYLGYVGAMMQVDRAMYLYHYFIPLLFGMCLVCLLFRYGFNDELTRGDRWVYASLIFFTIQIVAVFLYYAPFTYYQPLSATDVWRRAWVSGWKLTPIY